MAHEGRNEAYQRRRMRPMTIQYYIVKTGLIPIIDQYSGNGRIVTPMTADDDGCRPVQRAHEEPRYWLTVFREDNVWY